MTAFDAEDIPVYALSYDEADALRDFRDAHGIGYTLLSDPDSRVIRDFGILNTLIDENDHPWFGIPYPGTYVISTEGTITHKFFDNNLAVRAGPEQLLRAVTGAELVPAPDTDAVTPEGVQLEVLLEGQTLTPTVQRDLIARFRVPSGRHVYAEPAPEGSVAVDLVLDANDAVVQRPIKRPPSVPHKLAGTGESFQVHHERFELRLPITINSGISAQSSEVLLTGEVRWQSCDDEVCDIPTRERFELRVPVARSPAVALGSKEGAALEPNAMTHFQKMSSRRSSDD